jgi:hypothetical protein
MMFNELFTSDLTTDTGGSALASFLMGYPHSAYRDGQKGSFGMRWTEFSAYLMDDFRATPKLTLNLGLRYDLFTPPVEQENRLANFDFSTGQFVSPQMPGVSASGDVKTDYNNFAPRIGFAWTPWNDKTVCGEDLEFSTTFKPIRVTPSWLITPPDCFSARTSSLPRDHAEHADLDWLSSSGLPNGTEPRRTRQRVFVQQPHHLH